MPAEEWLTTSFQAHLRRLAAAHLDSTGRHAMLQATMLMNEVWIRLTEGEVAATRGREHVRAIAAESVRLVLIDELRKLNAQKRGGGKVVALEDSIGLLAGRRPIDLLVLDEALREYAAIDPRGARVVELRFFGDLSEAEVAARLGVTDRTVRTEWAAARAWFRKRLGSGGGR